MSGTFGAVRRKRGCLPPVSPEVINILPLPGSEQGMDAPSEHIIVIYVSWAQGCLKIRNDKVHLAESE